MRGRQYFLILGIAIVFMLGITTAIIPIKAATPTVRIWVDQPLGYLPFQTPGTKFTFIINIATSGLTDGVNGIVMWKMDMRVNPNALDINTTTYGPPWAPSYAAKFKTGPGHFLYEWGTLLGSPPSLFLGTNDPLTGYQDEISETGIPTYSWGAGDNHALAYPKLLTVEITSKSDIQGSLIDLIDVMYRTQDGLWHTAEQVEDGYYGQPPTFMSEMFDPFDPTDPVGTRWHELYPNYSNEWLLTSWTDNGDGALTASDQIDMEQQVGSDVGWIYWWHVDAVTVTIHFTYKVPSDPGGDPTGQTADAEPMEPHLLDEAMTDPVGSQWHMIYPDYSKEFVITSWEDNNVNGVFDPSDQFDFEFYGEGTIQWAHLDSVSTDIILSFKSKEPPIPEFPLGLGLMMAIAPAIPIVYLWRKRKWVGPK